MNSGTRRRDLLVASALLPERGLLGAEEWQRSRPDVLVYRPKEQGLNDGDNEHFLVFESPKGDLLAMWTQSSVETHGDNHLMLARSKDGQKWSAPMKLIGPGPGEQIPEASWGFPLVAKSGRIYCLYAQDTPDRRDSRGRFLKINDIGTLYSDDDGHTWTRGTAIPWPKGPLDHPDGAGEAWNWIVYQKPIRDSTGRLMAGYSYWASTPARTDLSPAAADSGVKFMRFDNADEGPDPKDLKVTHLMLPGKGLTVTSMLDPRLTDCEEPSLALLPDKRLFVTMRTITGYIWYSVSDDDGESWRKAEVLRYRDNGDPVPHPKAPCPIYPMSDGRYLLLYFNNPGALGPYNQFAPREVWKTNTWNYIRRPAHLAVGEFRPKAYQPIWFSRPKLFADNDGVIAGPKKTAEIATYTSYTEYQGKRTLWYPDRKYYLLGKHITDDFLRDMKPEQ
jgi:hypothetical protein